MVAITPTWEVPSWMGVLLMIIGSGVAIVFGNIFIKIVEKIVSLFRKKKGAENGS